MYMMYTVENSIMHTVRRRPILCIIKYMHYRICHVLHEIGSLIMIINPRKYQESSAVLIF